MAIGTVAALIMAYMAATEGLRQYEKGQQRGLAREELALKGELAKAERVGRAKAAKETKDMTAQLIERLTKERGEERIAGREAQALEFIMGMGRQGAEETQDLAQIFSGMSERSVGGPRPRPNSLVSLLR
jgi:hypothetical protein